MTHPLLFNAATHVYTCGGRVVPSVTQVIESARLSGFAAAKQFNPDAVTFGGERGDAVHVATMLDDMNDLVEESVHVVVRPCLEGWRRFKAETGFVVEQIEQMVFDPVRWFGGTYDRLGHMRLHGRTVYGLFDIKTGMKQRATGYQTAAYLSCLPVSERRRSRFGVYLDHQGGYQLEQYSDRNDINVFYAALTVHHARRQ